MHAAHAEKAQNEAKRVLRRDWNVINRLPGNTDAAPPQLVLLNWL